MYRFVAAATVVLITVTVALSDEFVGRITKFEDGKITFQQFKKGEKSEPKTLPVTADCKFVNAKFNFEEKKIEVGEKLEGARRRSRSG